MGGCYHFCGLGVSQSCWCFCVCVYGYCDNFGSFKFMSEVLRSLFGMVNRLGEESIG